jgi:transcriptional regulator with XRE-family HTH domain
MADLVDEFKKLRTEKALSQRDVSEGTGVAVITVYTWEAKQRQPTLENFNKVLGNLGYELAIQPIASAELDAQHG